MTEEKLSRFREACRRGTDWLLGHLNDDGSIGPVSDRLYYYRVPWAFALVGEITPGSRVLDWISQHMFSATGEFAGVSPQGVFDSRYGSYPLACLIVGASMLDRHDIVYPGVRHLLTWQDPQTGGFYHRYDDMTETGEQEIFPTSQAGMTLLQAGHLQAAMQAGAWLKRLWGLQPDVENKLYAVYSRATGLITKCPEDQEALYVTQKNDPWQHHFNGGIAAAFLTKLYLATGQRRWLTLAEQYQDFSITTHACQFESMQTCKSGWGSGLLYVAKRQLRYRDWTIRMGDWFCEHQRNDGHWENTKFWTPNPTVADNIEVTAEFVMHVANIIAYLSVAEGGRSTER